MRVLLVEDSERLRELLSEALEAAGYGVDGVATARELYSSVAAVNYDLLIVDLDLGEDEGLTAIRTLRSTGVSRPILFVSARGEIDDRVTGLDCGADDYPVKPFDHAELLARVRALLRRPFEFQRAVLRRGKTELDPATLEVRCAGRPIGLRRSERRLLATLMRRRGPLPKSTIEKALSDFGRRLSANAIEALVSRLRKALSEADSGLVIETVRGAGYCLIGKGDNDAAQGRAAGIVSADGLPRLTALRRVIGLHGGAGSAEGYIAQSRLFEKGELAGFIVVCPQGISIFQIGNHRVWNSGAEYMRSSRGADDVGFIRR